MTALTAHDRWLEEPYQIEAAIQERLEAQETAIRSRIESEPEALANAVVDYFDASTIDFRCDGPELLTDFTLALAGAETLLDAVCHGDPVPDIELPALRALLAVVETAKRRQKLAVDDAVEVEMLK